ncbi:MAG TPA: type IV toxin-antitoxin system AbiEi family antitoxin domain-containing protein [Acidimicrobiales bacterium]|jgi:hypothetical protein|nr:type IV toxin-antitoxin system AbiEi family antitoxin domain-containing protein [Acidimicrobiales bacterium]
MKLPATSLAAGQKGLLTTDQLRGAGYSDRQIQHLVTVGDLVRRERTLYAVAGAPATKDQAILAAVLAAGRQAAGSHRTSAEVWRVPGFDDQPIEVSTPYGHDHEFKLGTLHQSCWLPAEHVVVVNGIRVTRPARMLFELAGAIGFKRFERAAHNAVAMRLAIVPELRAMLTTLARRGRPGTRAFRQVVDAMEQASGLPESGLELEFLSIVRGAGLPEPRLQVEIGDAAGFIARVDSVWDEQLVIGEVDSDRFHTAPLDVKMDERRDERLRALGYDIARFSEQQIRQRPGYVVRTLREKLRLAA